MNKWGKIFRKLVVVLGVSSLIVSSGCGSPARSMERTEEATDRAYYEEKATDVAYSEEELSTAFEAESVTESAESGYNGESLNINTNSNYNRKVIKTGEMTIQTEHFDQTINDLTKYLLSLKGYIESSNVQGNNFYAQDAHSRTATLTVRIPQAQFDAFVNKGGDFGNVLYLTCSSEDITSNYVDTEIRVKTLKARYERLLTLLDQSGKLSDLFEIEQEISNVTYEIERLSGTLNHYDALVDMSTLTIEVQEVQKVVELKKEPVTFGEKVSRAFSDSVMGIKNFMQEVLIMIVSLVPILIIFIPVVLIIYYIYKKRRQDKKRVEDKEDKR